MIGDDGGEDRDDEDEGVAMHEVGFGSGVEVDDEDTGEEQIGKEL